MAKNDFNKEIDKYLQNRQDGELKIIDVDRIRKEAPTKSVSDTHPNLREGEVQIIEKDPSWIQKLVNKKQETKTEPENEEFEKEEHALQERMEKDSRWQKLKKWMRRDDMPAPTPEKFEEEMEEIERKEEEMKEADLPQDEMVEGEKEVHEKRSRTIFGFIGRFRKPAPNEQQSEDMCELEEDLKSVSKITTNVMRKLAPEELSEYKKSPEFEEFKRILKKRNLIKEKKQE